MFERHCTQCGTAGAAGQNFCGRCGTPMASDSQIVTNASVHEPAPTDRSPPEPQADLPAMSDHTPRPEPTGASQQSQPRPPQDSHPEAQPHQPTGHLAPVADPVLFIPGRADPVRIPPGGSCTLGSDPTCDIVLDGDPYVSAHHARVTLRERGLVLTDTQSTNGTFVRVLDRTPLKAGDEIRIGTTAIRVVAPDPTA